jgi:DNA-binding MarR family transcriptional regulator
MINWYRIQRLLKPLCPDNLTTIDEMLKHLYIVKGYSLNDLKTVICTEVNNVQSIKRKLESIGVILRGRGGDNCSKHLTLTPEDFMEYSVRELARKFNVSPSTIRDRRDKILSIKRR